MHFYSALMTYEFVGSPIAMIPAASLLVYFSTNFAQKEGL